MKTLFYGGSVLPMEGPERAQALLIEDGRVRAAGALRMWSLAWSPLPNLREKPCYPLLWTATATSQPWPRPWGCASSPGAETLGRSPSG